MSRCVSDFGGIATTRQLLATGLSERDLTDAVVRRDVVRIRNGWYTSRVESDPAVRAVRVGGRLSGLAALIESGCWHWSLPKNIHVVVKPTDSRLRDQFDRRRAWSPGHRVVLSWDDDDRGGGYWLVGVGRALRDVILEETAECAVIACDWALRTGAITMAEFSQVVAGLPAADRWVLDEVDAASDSILESTVRFRCRQAGLRVRSQVPLPPHSAIDLEVERYLAIDTDGREHHERSFERDRRKDLAVSAAGKHPMRLTPTPHPTTPAPRRKLRSRAP